jgi:hypothetical protein
MAEIKFEIIKHLAVLSEGTKGWTKEVNIVSWNNRKPKVDIREWDENHEQMSKGITLNKEDMISLKELLLNLDVDQLEID